MVNRRQFVKGAGVAGAAGLAGCTGGGGQQTEAETEIETEPETETQSRETDGGSDGGDGTATPMEGPAVTENQIHILSDYSNEAWQKTWEEAVVPSFNEEYPDIPVNVEFAGFQGTGEQRLVTLLQSGNAPESFTGNIDQVGDLFIQDQLQPVNRPTRALEEQNGDLVAPLVTIDGKNYVVPHGVYTSTIHYRRDILERLSLDPPGTWSDLRSAARAIDEDGDVDARGFGVSAAKAGQSSSYFALFYLANGAWYIDWNEDETGARLWFPEDEAIETLEYLVQMSEYSPDPPSINWGSSLSMWASNRLAMTYHLNGWAAGVAASAGNTEIAANTGIEPIPEKSGVEPEARSSVTVDGHPILSVSDNVGGAFEFFKHMYRNPEVSAQYYINEPTRFIPAYNDVFEAENYRNSETFQEIPNLLDLNLKSRDEMAPLAVDSDRFPETPATIFVGRFPIIAEMMNQAITVGRPPKAAVTEAKDRYETRLEEGRTKA